MFLARNTGGDSEHSDSSPATSPPAIEKITGAFSFNDLENYQQSSELCEAIINLRSVFFGVRSDYFFNQYFDSEKVMKGTSLYNNRV